MNSLIANKGAIGCITTGAWSIIAQVNPATSPVGGEYTIVGLLVLAVIYLVKEVNKREVDAKAEREKFSKSTQEHHKENMELMKAIVQKAEDRLKEKEDEHARLSK